MDAKFASLVARLDAVTTRLETLGPAAASSAPSAPAAAADDGVVSPAVLAFDDLLAGEVAAYVGLAGKIGAPDVLAQAQLVQQAFEAQRAMLLVVSKAKKVPMTDAGFQELIKPTSELIGAVQGKVDRRSDSFNHLQAMGEAIPALGWVCVEKTPGPHIKDMWECGQFNQQKIVVPPSCALVIYKAPSLRHP